MRLASLYSRITVAFALVLLGFGIALGWLSYRAAKDHQHEVMQQLSADLARHIAGHGALIGAQGFDRAAIDGLFNMARVVNPTIELYLLDADGVIVGHSPPDAKLALQRVSLAPVRRFLEGSALPILGDSPRSAGRPGVFSAAPIVRDGRTAGYLYVVLVGDMYRQQADDASRGHVLRATAWSGAAALVLALLVGLALFAFITRRLNRLTGSVQAFARRQPSSDGPAPPPGDADEIARLSQAFDDLTRRLDEQRVELQRQNELRRELVANLSHDLRTPLTSMQNYLETLLRLGDSVAAAERRQYLEVAVRQSHRVARLSQQLFELARLEGEEALPQAEPFSLPELLQDIGQKFELIAAERGLRLQVNAQPRELSVVGDVGLIERVVTNLLDNALRHTPRGGEIRLEAASTEQGAEVRVADSGAGIAAEHLPGLFERDSPLRRSANRGHGGLGLLIAKRILALHGTRMAVASEPGRGTVFSFALPATRVPG